jgi:hypothetical protein
VLNVRFVLARSASLRLTWVDNIHWPKSGRTTGMGGFLPVCFPASMCGKATVGFRVTPNQKRTDSTQRSWLVATLTTRRLAHRFRALA